MVSVKIGPHIAVCMHIMYKVMYLKQIQQIMDNCASCREGHVGLLTKD